MGTSSPTAVLTEKLWRLLLSHNASLSPSGSEQQQQQQQQEGGLTSDPVNSSSASSSSDRENPYALPWWLQMTYATAFGAMLTVATIGNAIVIWAVLNHRVMRSPTNYFLVNVSLADLMMATFNAMFNFAYMIHNHWPFGSVYCTVNNFVANLTVALSVFSLVVISVDRYVAIMKPLRPRITKKVAVMIIVVIWLAGALLSLPNLLYSTTIRLPYDNASFHIVCILEWPDGPSILSKQDYIYNVVFMAVTYFLPISAMSFAYLKMGRELWSSTWIGESCDKQMTNIKSKRKIVRMFIVMVTIVAICWLPYHAYFIYTAHHQEAIQLPYIQHVYLAFYWLAMSSSMYNPIIYVTMNARFRQYFKTALLCFRPQSPGTSRGYSVSGTRQSVIGRHSYNPSMSDRNVALRRQTSNGHDRNCNDGHQVARANKQPTTVTLCSPNSNGQVLGSTRASPAFKFVAWFHKPGTARVIL